MKQDVTAYMKYYNLDRPRLAGNVDQPATACCRFFYPHDNCFLFTRQRHHFSIPTTV